MSDIDDAIAFYVSATSEYQRAHAMALLTESVSHGLEVGGWFPDDWTWDDVPVGIEVGRKPGESMYAKTSPGRWTIVYDGSGLRGEVWEERRLWVNSIKTHGSGCSGHYRITKLP